MIITPNYPIKRVYDILNALKSFNLKKVFDDPTHICFYNFSKLEKVLKNYFEEIRLFPTGGVFYKYLKNNYFSHKIIGVVKK